MDDEAAWKALRSLAGIWDGNGEGFFPTIEPFSYREVLEIDEVGSSNTLHYQQRTWRRTEGAEQASHLETGFISSGDAGSIEILNAQGGDRVEVLRGPIRFSNGVLVIELESVVLAHDHRMLRSWREFRFEGDRLRYTMGMATTAVPEGAPHLTATLTLR